MILSRRSIFSGAGLAIAMTLPACDSKPSRKNPMDMDFRDTYGPRQQVVKDQSGNLPVAKGKPTFAYMIEFPCTVRVMEIDSKRIIATGAAKQGDILAIDKKNGVTLNNKSLANGPLEPLSEYGIFCDRDDVPKKK
jgi:hypothetical protein